MDNITGKFNRELAKETEQQSMQFDDPSDSTGIELKSPGKMPLDKSKRKILQRCFKSMDSKTI